MRLLFIGDRWGPGGGTSGQLFMAAHGLAARGHAVGVAVESIGASVDTAGLSVGRLPSRRGAGGRAWWRRAVDELVLRHDGPSLAWVRGPQASVYRAGGGSHRAWMAARGASGLVRRLRDQRELRREGDSLAACGVVVVNSNAAEADLRTHGAVGEQRVVLVRNGVDLDRFAPRPRETKDRGGEREVIFVGQGWRRKGLHVALRAFELWSRRGDRLVIVAPTRDLRAAMRVARVVPRGEIVHVAPGAHLPALLARADALVLPTLYDSSANVVLEALACGCAPVTSVADGAAEIVGDPGLIVSDPRDPEGVARAVRYAVTAGPPERWRALAEVWPGSRMVQELERVLMEFTHG